MVVTIPDTVVAEALERDPSGTLYGRVCDGGDVVQVLGLAEQAGLPIGQYLVGAALPAAQAGMGLLVLLDPARPGLAAAYYAADGSWQPAQCLVIRPYADYTARLRGLFDAERLAKQRVAVLGLGTGGGMVAAQLARCGLGALRLADYDRLEVHNIARHVCTLADVGRYKTRAVADLLCAISPIVQVEADEFNLLDDPARLEALIDGCDLVVAATDSEQSKLAINRACWARGVPAVYGAAYNRAFGGDIFRALPPDGACYQCFHDSVSDFFGAAPMANDLAPAYADPTRLADLIAEPGLSIDVGMIALLMTRVALAILLGSDAPAQADLGVNWVLFGNRAEWIFQQPLESIFVDIPRRDACPVCRYDAYVQSQLGLSAEQVAAQAHELIAQAPQLAGALRRRGTK